MNSQTEIGFVPSDVDIIIGVDEAGRGALAGPVGVGAVARILCEPVDDLFVVRDSKKMTRRARMASFAGITGKYIHAVELVPNETVDELNVLQATLQGMRTAVMKCVEGVRATFDVPDVVRESQSDSRTEEDIKFFVLVDGNQRIPDLPDDIEQMCVTKGDGSCYTIAMASILAKESRDVFVENDMHTQFPAYEFNKHKGYGTSLHYQKIQELGPCPFHRTSFQLTPRPQRSEFITTTPDLPEHRWA